MARVTAKPLVLCFIIIILISQRAHSEDVQSTMTPSLYEPLTDEYFTTTTTVTGVDEELKTERTVQDDESDAKETMQTANFVYPVGVVVVGVPRPFYPPYFYRPFHPPPPPPPPPPFFHHPWRRRWW